MRSAPASNEHPIETPRPAAAEARRSVRELLAAAVWAHHLLVFVFIAVAWALPWAWSLWLALIFYPLVQLNWWWFGNRCVLTVLEEKLRRAAPTAPPAEGKEPLHFVQGLGSRLLGRPVSRVWADVVSYGVVWGGFTIAGLRLYLRG